MDRELSPNRPGVTQFISVYRRRRLRTIPDDANESDSESGSSDKDELSFPTASSVSGAEDSAEEIEIDGILYDFKIYTGKSNTLDGKTESVVLRLSEKIPQYKNFKLYFDKFFTILNLLQLLKANGILALGTIRQNRLAGAINFLKTSSQLKQEGRGSLDFVTDANSGLCLVKWQEIMRQYKLFHLFWDQNLVMIAFVDGDRKKSDMSKSLHEMVRQYNIHMGGVDPSDILLSLYPVRRRPRQWYIPIFFHLVQLCIVNSRPPYRRQYNQMKLPPGKQMSLLEFQTDLATALLGTGKVLQCRVGTPFLDKGKDTE